MTLVSENPLLEASFLQRLQRLQLLVRRPLPGQWKGEHRSPKRGYSVEFADFREYSPGDDLRYVDWKAYGRLDRLYLKQYVEEEDIYVLLLVDCSRSMRFGQPTKLLFAQQVAAAIGYIALCRFHRVGVGLIADGNVLWMRPVRGKQSLIPLLTFLGNLPEARSTLLAQSMRQVVNGWKHRGAVYLLTDLMDERWNEALRLLLSRRHELILIHTLSPQELNPDLMGDLLLVDSETGETREVSLSASALSLYQRALQQLRDDASALCGHFGGNYLLANASQSLEDFVLREMRIRGVLA
ncbi:MAG: hypothetical protein KatS3mg022_0934 [Armatimonadota bacterium]|nr:MAG: hypothetical protein KatS3mg022_0934 [Armatimonadota bacterium]